MDIYVIRWRDGKTEEFKIFSQYRIRIAEIEAAGYIRGEDFASWQEWH